MLQYLPEFDLSNLMTYVFFCFTLFAIIQLYFALFVFGKLAFHSEKKIPLNEKIDGVSIIIAARNEAENLFQNLPFILEQNFPKFEVIIVNHQSVDDSKYILEAYKQQYPHLRTIEVERGKHLKFGKKLPLTLGIKGAKYEHLLFTDADCLPSGQNWLKSMASRFIEKKEIVLGYGPYKKTPGMLNRLIRFDTAWIGMTYLSFAKARMPYMGIGRNLAYTKTAYNRADGFKSHYGLASGDDDLFIQDAAQKKNYIINIDPDSFCYSKANDTWEKWLRQKSRHYTTSSNYKVFKKLMLGIYPLSLLIMLGTFVSLLLDSSFIWLSLASFILVLITKWIVMGRSFKRLGEKGFIAALPLWDIFYTIWATIIFYSVSKTDRSKW
ncbi:MAG: glycosyltransferase [Crocinitomicaceae bacterium]|nr:glycosyltransferase [Crocinitomicaceae bacterium]